MNFVRERFFELGVGIAQFSAIPDQEKYENIRNIAFSLELEFPNYNDLKNKPWWNFVPPLKWFARTNGEAFRNCYEIGMLVYLRFLLALPPNPNTRIEQINQAEEKLKNLFELENYDLEILDDYLTSLKTDTPDEVNESLRVFVRGFPTVFPSADEQKIRETRDKPGPPSDNQYDVFISHATEDKDEIVRPLADALIARNVRVWYDEFELRIGDSLNGKIDEGLANSRFGIVVLSHAFFQKNWAQRELNALVAREMADEAVILPLWHKITGNEIMAYSPGLTDKIALNTSNFTINEIAQEIAEVIQNARGPLSKKITY